MGTVGMSARETGVAADVLLLALVPFAEAAAAPLAELAPVPFAELAAVPLAELALAASLPIVPISVLLMVIVVMGIWWCLFRCRHLRLPF